MRNANRVGRRVPVRGIVSLALSLVAVAVYGGETPDERLDTERLLVGAVVGQVEVGPLDVWRVGDDYLIPVEEFADYAGCRLQRDDYGITLRTPLGDARLDADELREHEGALYVSARVLEQQLATSVSFDAARYALRFDLPWRPSDGERRVLPIEHEADVSAPSASLSTIYADVRHTRFGSREFTQGGTTLGGALGGGYWRVRYQSDFDDQHTLRDYAWIYRGDDHLVLAGNQRVRIHPLLRGIEFTGVQYARTNQDLDLFARRSTPSELLSRQMQPIATFEGYGPAAGFAELWIDGVFVDREPIGLDRRYEFLDVSIGARQSSHVEIRLFDRHNPTVPVEIVEEHRTASAFLLPGGASMHMTGGGIAGNAVQNQLDPLVDDERFAGFYQTRYGLSDRLTLEGALQGGDDGAQLFGGYTLRLNRTFVLGLGVGSSTENAHGYSVDIEGLPLPFRVLGRLQESEAGFDPLYPFYQRDHYLEVGYSGVRNLDVAVIGRSRLNSTVDVDYLLPAASWRPTDAVWLNARPDLDGDYRYDLLYRFRPLTRFSLSSVKDRRLAQLWHGLRPNLQLSANADVGGRYPERYAVLAHGFGRSRWRPSWAAGPLWTGGRPGYLLDGRLTLSPGLVAQARLESSAIGTDEAATSEPRLLVNLFADLGLSGGRLVAASTTAVREGRGGIAGVVHVDAPRGFPRFDLGDLPVSLD
ncbi:MAG TPA: hypothetical protein VD788_01205, partial [Candidatus Polarisedimenticolaceae bacterium]|nr:hypothetical protein [Candidatus Polarisedimenticolaceae bacterium]